MAVQTRENVPSSLLQNDENDILFSLLESGCKTVATGVAQLFIADPPKKDQWSKKMTGVACFVKDNKNRTYYIRVYDLKQRTCVWEQEIYNEFEYKAPRDYFHTFETEEARAGLNFASEDEAVKFKTSVEEMLRRLKKRINKDNNKNLVAKTSSPPPRNVAQVNSVQVGRNNGNLLVKNRDKKKEKRQRLTKDDIGTPTNFEHIAHLGLDAERGFENLDEDFKNLCYSVGLDNQMDKETLDFIQTFVQKNGGMEQVKKEIHPLPLTPKHPPAQPPPPPPPPIQYSTSSSEPPARPRNPPSLRPLSEPPSGPNINRPPPPVPKQNDSQLPPKNSQTGSANLQPPPASVTNAPPLPPTPTPPPPAPVLPPSVPSPPPLTQEPSTVPPPPPPPPPPSLSTIPSPPLDGVRGGDGAGRGALLASIRNGTTLRKTKPGENRPCGEDARENLLSAIKGGTSLRHVEQQPSARPVVEEQGGIVGALAKALASRSSQIQGSDNESDDSEIEDDYEEWDD